MLVGVLASVLVLAGHSGSVTASTVSASIVPVVDRIAGADRFDTAARISQRGYPSGAGVVYIASGRTFPDALSAAPAAAHSGGPLLLTDPGELPASTETELRRLRPTRIVIAGGTASVSAAVERALSKIAPTSRSQGNDRYETSIAVALGAFVSASVAYLATGDNFPDALSASSAAGAAQAPVFLVAAANSSESTNLISALRRLHVSSVRIAGGTSTVSTATESQIIRAGFAVTRLAGADRYATSVAINAHAYTSVSSAYLASGENFPDALAGGAVAGRTASPLFISPSSCISDAVLDEILALGVTKLTLLGGLASLSDRVAGLHRCSEPPPCVISIVGTVAPVTNVAGVEPITGTTTEDLQSFADTYNNIRVAHCLEPIPYANFTADACMLDRLMWMAESPSLDPLDAWGHTGSTRSDGAPARGCDGNLAGGGGNTGATVAQKWWDSPPHRASLYRPAPGCVAFAMTHGGVPSEPASFTRAAARFSSC